MGQFILDGIQFTADNSSLSTAGKKTSKFGNTNNGIFLQAAIDKGGVKPFVNAVEIDWNGAVVGENKTLNTTGEVLSRYKVAI